MGGSETVCRAQPENLETVITYGMPLMIRGIPYVPKLYITSKKSETVGFSFTPAHRSTSPVKKYTLLPYVWWCAPFLLPRDTHNMDHLFRGGPHIFDISLRLLVSNTVRK